MTRFYSRRLLSLVSAASLGLAVAGPVHAAAPTTWQMRVGVETDRQGIQVNGFLPQAESIDVGDTVTWTVETGEPHTISFLSGGPAPPVILPGPPPSENPVAAAPAGGSSYAGTGFFNSGFLVKGQKSYSLTFTAPGDYAFLCLIHSDMVGIIHVANAGAAYPHTQGFYDRQADATADHLLDAGRSLREAGQDVADAEPDQVVVGTGALLPGLASLFVPRFLAEHKVIKAGETVTWTNIDPATPHTITFGPEPGDGDPLAAFPPSGTDRPGHATISAVNQPVNSGFIGTSLPFGTGFSATFTKPGTYSYICALHDTLGMVGVIQVVPGDD